MTFQKPNGLTKDKSIRSKAEMDLQMYMQIKFDNEKAKTDF